MNKHIFREYDIRGVVSEDLTQAVVENLGKAIGSRVVRSGGSRIAVGRDVRLSSPQLLDYLSAGLTSTGCSVADIGTVPTPLLYFSQFHLDVNGGVMITGSHNPPEFNGFKLLVNGDTLHGKEIQKIAREMEEGDFAVGSGEVLNHNVIDPYIDMVKDKVSISKPVKVVVDSGNGCGGLLAPRLLRELGCEVVELYSEPDGTFPNHHPDPTVEANMTVLKKTVVEQKAALGIGYDGDADRIGVVDDSGKLLFGDELLMIFARDMLSRVKGGKVIFDVKCSNNLPDYIKRFGGEPIMSATGHSIIKQRLKDEKAALAGEMSAHIFFAEDYYGFDDAIYASARIIQIADQADIPVSRFLEDLPKTYSTPEIRVDCPDDEKFGIVGQLVEYYRAKYDVLDMDGVRINFKNGWGLIRASNTQPVLVLRFEAFSQEELSKYKKEVFEKLITFAPMAGLKPF